MSVVAVPKLSNVYSARLRHFRGTSGEHRARGARHGPHTLAAVPPHPRLGPMDSDFLTIPPLQGFGWLDGGMQACLEDQG